MPTKPKAKKIAKKTPRKATAKKTRKEGKSAQVRAMLAKGTTRPAVLAAVGWKGISFQVVARNAGLKLHVDETQKPFVYRTEG